MTDALSIAIIMAMDKMTAKTKIIRLKNKKSGVVYLYEDHAFWNKEKKRGEHKRKCIGHIDAQGNIVYNSYYQSKMKVTVAESDEPVVTKTVLMGQNLVINSIVKDSGVGASLKEALGAEDADKVLQLAGFSLCEGKALCRAEAWLDDRGYDGSSLRSQRITELLRSLSTDRQNAFFKTWLKKQSSNKTLLLDITSISSYSRGNPYVERGYNRDHERLPQINLGLLASHTTNVPLWYTELPGSMSDAVVLDYVLDQLDKFDVKDITLVGDRGFYSEANIRHIVSKGQKFTIPVPSRVSWQKKLIDSVRGTIRRPANIIKNPFDDNSYIYGVTSYKMEDYGRTWRHVYFDPIRKEQDIASLMLKLRKCQEELLSGQRVEQNAHLYETYFIVKESARKGLQVCLNEKAVDEYINSYSGYWVILTNSEKDAAKALEHYNRRTDIEQHFDDMKNLLDCDRLNVHSEQTMKGRLFVNFITQILLNTLRNKLSSIKPKERNYWDSRDILNKVATYSRIHFNGRYKDVWTIPTKAQRLIFDMFGIEYHWKGKELDKVQDKNNDRNLNEILT